MSEECFAVNWKDFPSEPRPGAGPEQLISAITPQLHLLQTKGGGSCFHPEDQPLGPPGLTGSESSGRPLRDVSSSSALAAALRVRVGKGRFRWQDVRSGQVRLLPTLPQGPRGDVTVVEGPAAVAG